MNTTIDTPPLPSTPPSSSAFDQSSFNNYVMDTYGRFPITLVKGKGCQVWDAQGNEYLDFVAGISTCTLGHGHPVIIETVTTQIHKLQHVSNFYYTYEQGYLAQWLVENSCTDKVFFCNSGAEANEGALKLARKYAHTKLGIKDPVILTAQRNFHGRTLVMITAAGSPKYQKNFAPLVPGFQCVPFNDIEVIENTINEIDKGDRRVAAIMLEPLQGEGGIIPGDLEYFLRLRKICDQTGILLICDEVQAGMGRTGKLWGYENLGIEPDIITSAKGLGGGIPIGAVMCKDFCAVFEHGEHGSTFGGNPFACAVGLAVAKTLKQDNILANVQGRGEQLRTKLRAIAQKFPQVFTQVRGWGLINGLVIREDVKLTSIDLVKAAMAQGLLLAPAREKVLRFVPPLIVSAEEVDQAGKLLETAIEKCLE